MNFRENPMKISVPKKKWAQANHQRSFAKLAKHVMSHYPKDSTLHKAVRDSFKSMNDAAAKLEKGARKAAPKRARKRPTRRRSTGRRSAPRKRSTARRSGARRRTARSWAPKRRSAPARRTARRRATRRRNYA